MKKTTWRINEFVLFCPYCNLPTEWSDDLRESDSIRECDKCHKEFEVEVKKMSQIIEIINKEFENPYPKDIFLWDNKEKITLTRGRLNEFRFSIVENTKREIIKIVEENG